MIEEWRPAVGAYWVSSLGRVRGKTGVLALDEKRNGYLYVKLYSGLPKPKSCTVHSLVATAFIGPRPAGMEINHKNGIRGSNLSSNLEYVTRSQNIRHAVENLGMNRGTRGSSNKLSSTEVRRIRSLCAEGLSQSRVGRMFGVCQQSVSDIISGANWGWLKAILVVVSLSSTAFAQRVGEVGFTVDSWGGIDTQHDSARISDFDAQTAENVLTDSGRLEKRTGNTRTATILSGYPNKAIREFVPASLTRYVIAHASDTVYQTDLGGTVTSLSTVTAGANVDMVQALNTLIVQDGQRTAWTWNATSTASVGSIPVCKYMEYANERVYCGNIPSQSTSRVAVSSYGSVSYFTVPANVSAVAEAPNTFDFQREDGDVITCLKATRCGMFVGKSRSTHIIKGYDNFTFRKDVISENIGCKDDRSVQTVDGNIVWLGQDAIYSWPCAGKPEPISRDIDPVIKTLRQGNSFSASWVLNTQGDFETGNSTTSGPGAPMSTTISPGSVVPTTWTVTDSTFTAGSSTLTAVSQFTIRLSTMLVNAGFEDGSFTNWTAVGDFSVGFGGSCIGSYEARIDTGSWTSASGEIQVLNGADNAIILSQAMSTPGIGSSSCADLTLDISTMTPSTVKVRITDGVDSLTTAAFPKPNGVLVMQFRRDTSSSASRLRFDFPEPFYASSGTYLSQAFDTGISTQIWGLFSTTFSYVSDYGFPETRSSVRFETQVATSASGVYTTTVTASDQVQMTSQGGQFVRYLITMQSPRHLGTPAISTISMRAVTTGYYTSPVKFVGTSISSYGALDMTESLPSGSSITYSVRAATYAFPADNINLTWTPIDNHETVPLTVSTPTYFQYRALFLPTRGDQTVELYRSQLSWTEGTASPPVASGWKDGRYFLCATISATATYPDTCLVRQRNGKWVKFVGFSAASMAPFNRDLIVGSGGTDSYVWKILQNDVYNDDGAAIASTWISKDFMFSPNGRDWAVGSKALNEIWLDTEFSSSTYLTVGYAVNKSTTYQTAILDVGAWGDSVNRLIPFTATPALGKYTKVKLYNAGLDKTIKVNGYSIYGEPNPKTQD